MLHFSSWKQRVITLSFFLSCFSIFFTNAQTKRPVNPFITNTISGCANDIIACNLFSNSQNYTCASSFTYAAPTNNNNCFIGSSTTTYGCLYSTPNQMWFVITVQTGGNLFFSFNNSNSRDIDAAIWGPISGGDLNNTCSTTSSYPVSCDYSASSTASLNISNAIAGQKYVLLVTNFSNASTDISIPQPSGGTVSYCKLNANTCVAPTVAISGNSTINQGDSANITLNFTGAAPYNYTLSNGQTGTTSTNPLTLSVSPLSSTTYTVTSVSNGCGAGTASGSATVSVSRTAGLITCFPLDGNSSDQIGSNSGSVFNNGGSSSYVSNRNGTSSSALSISNGAYVEFPTTNLLNNNFTHSLWVSPSSLPTSGNYQYILSIGGIGLSQELYIENDNGILRWVFRSSTTIGNVDVKYAGTISVGQWYHVAIVRTANALQMYINGVLVQSSSASGLSSTYASPSVGRLGSQSSGLVNFFNGKIDDVRLFKGGLNGLEISSLYNATLNCPTIVDAPLISLTSLTNSSLCRNQLEEISFQQSSVTAGSTYTVQLSDGNGGFSNPTIIGTGTLAPIQISIPTTVTTSGTGYRVRIVNGSTISFNTLPITILPTATGTISGTTTITQGQTANLSVNLTGSSPWIYSISDGTNTTTFSSTTASVSQTVSPLVTTTYTLASVKDNVCGTGTTNGSAIITVNSGLQLLACYPFNGNAQDSKGVNHGTVNGATLTTDRFGNANSAYNFDGISNYISIPGASLAPSQFTYSAWVNASELPAFDEIRTILSVGNDGGDQFIMLFNNSSTIGPAWNYGSYTSYATAVLPPMFSYTSVVANSWIHFAVVRTTTNRKMYINGQLVASNTATPVYYSTPPLGAIGARYKGIQPFKGKIDDVKIYNGALNDTQVQGIYLAEQQCPTVETGGLIALTSLSNTTSCPNGSVNVNVITNNITASVSTPLVVELSNSSGSFTSPVQIGSGTTNSITCSIPANITAGNYKIRVTYEGQVISVNTLSITINPAVTANISGTTTIVSGSSATLTINFTGASPWTYRLSGTSTDVTASTSPITVSVSPTTQTTYTITSVRNTCGVGTTSGSAVVSISTLPQLLACYPFNGNAQDSKGTNHGTVNGATLTTDRFGNPNRAYSFDGISNYISIPGANLAPSEYTYSAWVNASELPAFNDIRTILSIGNDGGDQFIMLFYNNYTTGPAWNYGSYTGYTVAVLPPMFSYSLVAANTWVHFTVARTTTSRKMYLNGQLIASNSATPVYYSSPILGAIGARYKGIQPFKGKIDDVKIYNGALTDEEVFLLYNEEQGECSAPCTGMIYSINSGDWNSPTTWSCGRIPDVTDKVLIKAGHNVTVSANNAKAKKLLNNGQISFSNSTAKLSFN
ncbi:concanavalin A-like lectin/glucanase superfamily protein [Arcicella aurantiaca]|uniref:Concanavalin A-like lectin/glucanase superfamily protein n=1 Tax=Arcicella aurantiaca TaxID=591202 RepID=A0A316E2R4_9BACT|nr:LamG domain-containing protein [Arcicella aurantiaca]PWK23023.1 concanavalin A-like lectin/glucanase superfamily protein [Arcicella aurantiaca]